MSEWVTRFPIAARLKQTFELAVRHWPLLSKVVAEPWVRYQEDKQSFMWRCKPRLISHLSSELTLRYFLRANEFLKLLVEVLMPEVPNAINGGIVQIGSKLTIHSYP